MSNIPCISDEIYPHLYSLLNCASSQATKEQIATEYKILALRYHPDKQEQTVACSGHFKKISLAFSILGNEEERRKYDLWLESGLSQEISYPRWRKLDDCEKNLHWRNKAIVTLKDASSSLSKCKESSRQYFRQVKTSLTLEQFRTYQI